MAKRAVRFASLQKGDELAKQALDGLRIIQIAAEQEGQVIRFTHRDVMYVCSVCEAGTVGKSARDEIMNLLETNMKDRYEASSMGWSRREKQGELFHKTARFFVLRKATSTDLVAFVNWRFDLEECDENDEAARIDDGQIEVLYCYEIQVSPSHQSQRLGKVLMNMLHSVAKQSSMRKAMLTVFLANEAARHFYQRLGYRSDLISPLNHNDKLHQGKTDYDILSWNTSADVY